MTWSEDYCAQCGHEHESVKCPNAPVKPEPATTIGYFIHRPDEYGNAPHLTSPYGYAVAKVYPSRAAARSDHGPLRGDEKLYRVVEDEL